MVVGGGRDFFSAHSIALCLVFSPFLFVIMTLFGGFAVVLDTKNNSKPTNKPPTRPHPRKKAI